MAIIINDDLVQSFDDIVLAWMNETGPNVLCGQYFDHPGVTLDAQQDLFECVGVEVGVPLVNGTQTIKWRRALLTSDTQDREIRTDVPTRLGYARHPSRRAASGYPSVMGSLTVNWADGAVEPCPDNQVRAVAASLALCMPCLYDNTPGCFVTFLCCAIHPFLLPVFTPRLACPVQIAIQGAVLCYSNSAAQPVTGYKRVFTCGNGSVPSADGYYCAPRCPDAVAETGCNECNASLVCVSCSGEHFHINVNGTGCEPGGVQCWQWLCVSICILSALLCCF